MTTLTTTDITPTFGTDIEGLDPSAKLSAADEQILRQTFDERGLLRFRGLTDLSATYQAYLASTVIGMEGAAGAGEKDDDRPSYVSNKRERGSAPFGRLLYHCDMMWSDNPFQVLTLFGLDVEQPAVPTVFVSAVAAWDSLPGDLRTRVDGLHATHVTGQQMRGDAADGELLRPEREHVQTSSKPIALRHPRTGRTILYVSQMMTGKIDELDEDESEEVLAELFAHLYDPATEFRHDWRNGDLVMWDNLAIQHARGNVEVEGPVRTLRKVIAPRSSIQNLEAPKFTKVS